MEIKRALLLGGVAVGGYLLGRSLIKPGPALPPAPDPGYQDGENWVLCGYQFKPYRTWDKDRPYEPNLYVPRITNHILAEVDNDVYAERLAERIYRMADHFGLPLDLLLAIARFRSTFGFGMEDEVIQQAITSTGNRCGTPATPQPKQYPIGPWGYPATLWLTMTSGYCLQDLLSETPWDRVDTAAYVFAQEWRGLINATGKLESFSELGTLPKESVCDVVDIARQYSDLR